MNFTKIKYRQPTPKKGPQVELHYAEATKSGKTEKHKLKCDEAPRPELLDALQAFRPIVISACMLGDEVIYEDEADELEAHITVRSVTIKRGDAGRSIVVTALRELDWIDSPLILNTPLAGELLIPAEDVLVKLDRLEDEARRYAEGECAQKGLFEGDGATAVIEERQGVPA